MTRHGTATIHADVPPDVAFRTLSDVERMPSWNSRMTHVVEAPAELAEGREWVIGFRYLGRPFNSRSVVLELDRERRRFVHRSKPDDDNPSCTVWTWQVEPEGEGSRITVQWDLRPVTFARRRIITPLRARQMVHQDAPESLAALVEVCRAVGGPAG
jgi:uncharacterized protein YndB with AHSA1/START domain